MSIAEKYGMSILEMVMKWCVGRKTVSSVITGMSKLSQLEQNLKSVEGEALSKEVLEACDGVWRSLAGTRFAYNR